MKPVNYYGYTKMLADTFMLKKLKKFFIFRVSWVYSKNSKRSFLNKIIKKINKKENIYVTSKEIGVPNSAYLIASILVKFVKILNKKRESLKCGIYNISNNGFASRYAFAKKIYNYFCIKNKNMSKIKILKSDTYITNVKRPNKVILSNNKIKKLLNLNIKNWENDLKKLIDKEL